MGSIDQQVQNDLVDIAGIASNRWNGVIEVGHDVSYIFRLISRNGDSGLNRLIQVGGSFLCRIRMGERFHCLYNLGNATGTIESLFNGTRYLSHDELEIAFVLGLRKGVTGTPRHRRGVFPDGLPIEINYFLRT